MNKAGIRQLLESAKVHHKTALTEAEGMLLLEALGIKTPERVFVKSSAEVAQAASLAGEQVVVKVVSPTILHKTEVGGVKVVANSPAPLTAAVAEMEKALSKAGLAGDIEGFTLNEFVKHQAGIGGELLLGMRWTEDFGPVVTLSPGGIYAEFLGGALKPGSQIAVFTPAAADRACLERGLNALAVGELFTRSFRGKEPVSSREALLDVIERFMAFAAEFSPTDVTELEINPLVATSRGLVALDALVKLGLGKQRALSSGRPVEKIEKLLMPRSVALIGVSEKMNPGHIILNNLIHHGFDKEQITIVKPGSDSLDGCRCVPDVGSIPGCADLFVLSVAAAQVPQIITEVVEHRKAESLIVIPGGLEEKRGTEQVVARMREVLEQSRKTAWRGPVINGGNCLGIRSVPGRYDTMFIPDHKFGRSEAAAGDAPLAILSQSGAFAVSRKNRLLSLNPRYMISIGNQMDLTAGDYLEFLERDPAISVFAVYLEGFKPLDGAKFITSARRIIASGRKVILYRAGRTSAGAQASASHTASIAGDYAVTRALCEQIGIVLAESLDEFDDLVGMFTRLLGKTPRGRRLGAVSNAGFECVATADSLCELKLAQFEAATVNALNSVFQKSGIAGLVDVHNPLDLTPMAGDQAYEDVARLVLEDASVDIGLIGCVPLTPALNTLAAGPGHQENCRAEGAVAARLGRLMKQSPKPWVAVVDAGPGYEAMISVLEAAGVPTYTTADRAMKLFTKWVLAHESKL